AQERADDHNRERGLRRDIGPPTAEPCVDPRYLTSYKNHPCKTCKKQRVIAGVSYGKAARMVIPFAQQHPDQEQMSMGQQPEAETAIES
ncbi:hypothetical protein C1X83_35200, partial [Pseudomonas sp. GP01-A4]